MNGPVREFLFAVVVSAAKVRRQTAAMAMVVSIVFTVERLAGAV
jgi:hypothetical protein